MGKRIRDYVKYSKSELENYTKLPGTCVLKINKNIHINFPPYGLGSMQSTLLHIISDKKIGSYDYELSGIILDIRNIKVLGNVAALRFDDPTLHIDIQADCYVFKPQIGSIVRGLVKHIAQHQISVIIYRVFNVSIRLSATERYDNSNIELNSEIEFRIKSFDLENLMPYIEGELVAREMPLKCLEGKHIYLNISDSDSNTTENEEESKRKPIKVPRKRKKSLTLPPTEETDDEEIVFSEIFHLKPDEVSNIKTGINKIKKTDSKIQFSENFRLQPDEVEEIAKDNNKDKKKFENENNNFDNITNITNIESKRITAPENNSSDLSDKSETYTTGRNKIPSKKKSLPAVKNSNSSDDEVEYKYTLQRRNSEMGTKFKISKSDSSSVEEIENKNFAPKTRNDKTEKNKLVKLKKKIPENVEIPSSETEVKSEADNKDLENHQTNEKVEKTPNKGKSKINTDSDASTANYTKIKSEPTSTTKRKRKLNSVEENFSCHLEENVQLDKQLNEKNKFCTPNSNKNKRNKKTSESSSINLQNSMQNILNKVESVKRRTTSMSSTDNVSESPKKHTPSVTFLENGKSSKSRMSKSNSVDDALNSIMARVLSQKTESPKKKIPSESSSINIIAIKKESAESTASESEDNAMDSIVTRVLSNKTEVLTKKRLSELSSMNNIAMKEEPSAESEATPSVDNAMDSIMARILANKIESPKKNISSEAYPINEKNIKKQSAKKSTGSDINSVNNDMNSIMARVLSHKTESPKVNISSRSSSGNEKKIKKHSTASESTSVYNAIENIVSRALSNKTESTENNSTTETFLSNSPKSNRKSKSNRKAALPASSPVKISSEIINDNKTRPTTDINNQRKEKKLTDLDSSVAQLLAKVQEKKSHSTIDTINSINVKKRKLSNSYSEKSVKKPRKSNNFKSDTTNESTVDNNEISLNSDSFALHLLSSTKIESVKKKPKKDGKKNINS